MTKGRDAAAIARCQRHLARHLRMATALKDPVARAILIALFGRALVLTTRVPGRRRV